MNSFGVYLRKEKHIATILRALRDQGWVCPEYTQGRRTRSGLHTISEYFGTIAQKGEWSFVLWNYSPYAKEFKVPRGRNWALYYRDRLVDSGRNLKPPERVVERVVEKAEMSTEKLVAMVLASSWKQ